MTSKQRAYLKSLAQTMEPIFQIGKNSLTPENTKAIAEALEARELIKVSVLQNCMDDPKEIASLVAERTRSQVVQVIGKKIVLYKEGKEEKKKIVVVALVDTLEYLKRGGRISKTAAFAGGVLNIKPVLSVIDGEIHLLGKARGSKMGNNLLVQEIDKAGGIDFSRPVLLGYSGISDALLLKYIEDSRHIWEGNLKEIRYTTVGSVIGTHAGPGAVVVAFFKNQYNAEQNSSD